jgi:signal transduction histidine kinase
VSVRRAPASATPWPVARVLTEAGVALAAVAAVFFPDKFGGLSDPAPMSIALLAAAVVATPFRQRATRTAVVGTVALTVGALLVDGALAASFVTVLVTVFTVGKLTDRLSTIVAAIGAIAVIWSTSAIVLGPATTDVRAALLIVASIGFAAASGDASRSRRAYIEEITERARQAEETKEAEARRRVADERVAIARDLHDLVAHQIAVVSLNAGVASRAVRERPDDAVRALDTIYDAAQTVLGEISGLLTVLRTSDASPSPARLAPTPGLAQLPELLGQFRSSGLSVALRTDGGPREIPAAADGVAYRALHEALTNALKHGGAGARPASAVVHLDYQADELVLTVTNPVSPPRPAAGGEPARGGHGLDGVRERVAAVRGRVQAGPGPGSVFRFTARLPAPGTAAKGPLP